MHKIKTLLLTIFLIITICSVCFAENQWFSVYEDSKVVISLDITRIVAYHNDGNYYLDCWVKTHVVETNTSVISHRCIDVENLKYKDTEKLSYKVDKFLGKTKLDEDWKTPPENSKLANALESIILWITNNHDKVIQKESI
ncbi:MAG: hypothetical protein LLG02_09065 [Pelosinus sp.]|nr:hypothetical protein [Pelosinus sp.]